MTRRASRWLSAALLAFFAGMALAQSTPPHNPDAPPPGMATKPLAGARLSGASELLGDPRLDGELRRPLVDFSVRNGSQLQRVSFFEGGLVCVHLTDAGAPIYKRLLFPQDAMKGYLDHLPAAKLREVPADLFVFGAVEKRVGMLRIYEDGGYVERTFDPVTVLPKTLADLIAPLQNLIRAISDDNRLSNRIAGYQPRVGDYLIGEDRSTYQVIRILGKESVIELRRDNQPTTIFVPQKDVLNYFSVSRKAGSK
jgi:hypothetical protein